MAQLRAQLVGEGQVAVFAVRGRRVHDANPAARAAFEMLRVGGDVGELFDERSREKLAKALRRSGAGTTLELQVRRFSGPPFAVRFLVISSAREELFIAQPRTGRSERVAEKLLEANCKLANTTRELSRHARDLDLAKQRLQQEAELREMFIAALAHDLKGPLSAILLTERSLRDKGPAVPTAETERHADRVERNARRMLALIDNLLLAARLDSIEGAPPPGALETLRIDEIARAAAADLGAVADEARVTLVVTAAEPVRAPANGAWLEQVFSNLFTNAIRHSPPGGVVDATISFEAGDAVCEVADRGPGVSPEDRERIFERFVQRGTRRGSIGLGLYVCQRIVSLHGGRIGVETNPGGGARFVFTLPRASTGGS